eukprot:Tamp_16408.p1 GENE.Tamp_16408~~Tamp_16408.p1  ORF type:complete len:286 (-),score=87.32 Tamp_16408:610-1467(-)
MRQALGAAVIAAMTAGAEGFAPAQLMPFGAGGGVLCAMRQPPALALRAPFRTGPTLHAKKKKGSKKKGAGASVSEEVSKDDDDEMDFPVDAGGASMSSAVKGASEDDMPKFTRDRSLEAMFVDIPKEALAPLPKVSKDAKAATDPDAAFGLSGDVVRFIKKGTWASVALLVLALVVVRSPLMGAFRPDESVELAKKAERSQLDREGKTLPGIRPFPSLQATEEEVLAGKADGTAVKIVDDVEKAGGNGFTVNIGGGQKIKLVKKKKGAEEAAAPAGVSAQPADQK